MKGSLNHLTDKYYKKPAYHNTQEMWQKPWSTRRCVLLVYWFWIVVSFVLVLVVVFPKEKAPERINVQCMDDWVLYRGKCYYFSDKLDTWMNSQNFCKSHNSSLAIIDNEKEMKFLNLLSTNKYWIGLSRAKNDSGWVGTDGTFYSKTISVITRNIPDPGESEHVYLNGEGFKSGSGKYPKKWICSKRLMLDIHYMKHQAKPNFQK
ncbi:C-type lectin domain family 2 member A-like isoform X2 [Aquarana catesbeiana]|uniref:C-type lectin domain family 2 member A-like isoform X2 n=1 Tax=Aquarana catesbeiana TaxID=8400 RepID=UPI003CCA0D3C